jgi:hypothetical protein
MKEENLSVYKFETQKFGDSEERTGFGSRIQKRASKGGATGAIGM